MTASLWQPTMIILDVHMMCGAEESVTIHVTVPAPGFPQTFAAEVKAAASSSQLIAVVSGGASPAASLGRVMATRSMVMCDADAAVSAGGVLQLSLIPCSSEANSNNAARSAVISNLVLVCIVGLVLVLCAMLLALADPSQRATFFTSTTTMLLPSSLLTVFVSVLPSTSASATLLAARLGASNCGVVDVVLILLAIVTSATPIVLLLLLSRYASWNHWECVERHELVGLETSGNCLVKQLQHATRRRYTWRHDKSTAAVDALQRWWVVLLEYRVLWYAAVDSVALVAVGVFAVVGGISRCTPLIAIVIALLCAQLLLIIIVQPYTTLFENIYSAVTLGLTVVSVAGQLVFTTAASGEAMRTDWALTLSAVCDFVIVGVSLVKSILDGYGVLMGVYRRVHHAASLRRTPGWDSKVSRRAHVDEERNEDAAMNLEDVALHAKRCVLDEDQTMVAEIELQFWDASGAARLDVEVDDDDDRGHQLYGGLYF